MPDFNTLESALDFLEHPQPQSSKDLCAEIISRGDSEMRKFTPLLWVEMKFSRRTRRRVRLATVFLLIFFCILAARGDENASNAVRRFYFPWENYTWNLNFRPQWKTFPQSVRFGETFDAEISLQKPVPFLNAAIWYENDGRTAFDGTRTNFKNNQTTSIENQTDFENKKTTVAEPPSEILRITPIFGRYFVRIPDVTKPFKISIFTEGDSWVLAPQRLVNVQTYANLTDVLIRIAPPMETGGRPEESGWNISGLSGSRIGMMIAADRPLTDAKVRFEDGTYIPGVPANNDVLHRIFKFRFELLRDCKYHLELTDTDGLTAELETHEIHTKPDLPPIPTFLAPRTGRTILPDAKIQLSLQAQDDFGLNAIGFRWIVESASKSHEKWNQSANNVQNSVADSKNDSKRDPKEDSKNDFGTKLNPTDFFYENDGFFAPADRSGNPKWTYFEIWNAETATKENLAENPKINTNIIQYSARPQSQQIPYILDVAQISVSAGMRLRVDPTAQDAVQQEAAGPPLFLNVISPEEMQQKTFRQWIAIVQELRRFESLISDSRKMMEAGLTLENAESAADSLSQCMNIVSQILNPEFPENALQQIHLLELDFSENPEFPFAETVTSRQQLQELQRLERLLSSLRSHHLPELNREIVQLSKVLHAKTSESDLSEYLRKKTENIQRLQNQILEILEPELKIWNRDEFSKFMQEDFQGIRRILQKTFQQTEALMNLAFRFSPGEMEFRQREMLHETENSLWEIRSKTNQYFIKYRTLLNSAGESAHVLRESEFQLLCSCDSAVRALQTRRFMELREIIIQMESFFSAFETKWILSPGESSNGKKMLCVFERMQKAQENILLFLENFKTKNNRTSSENQSNPNSPKKPKEQTITSDRSERSFLLECAETQSQFSTYFDDSKVPLPRALKPRWRELLANLSVSIEEFGAFSTLSEPPMEMAEDQYTLQLQIYDELAELAIIADGMSSKPGKIEKISDFENRANPKKEEGKPEDASEQGDSAAEAELSLTPEDVQILISMQQNVFDQTKALRENKTISIGEKAAEVDFLTEQQKKIVESARELKFDSHPNSSFDSILSQMTQVAFLFGSQDFEEMNCTIQEEILYELQKLLRRVEFPEENSNSSESGITREEENLSENADSQAVEPLENAEDTKNKEDKKDAEDSDDTKASSDSENLENSQQILQNLQNSVWGELPKRLQKELQTLPHGKPIPEYQQKNELYFQNLNHSRPAE